MTPGTEERATAAQAAAHYDRSLLEASLDPLVTISVEGKITDVNAATEKITGVDRAQLIGTDFSDYFTDAEAARAGYQRVFAEGSVIDYPLAIRHALGRVTDVLYNASLYRDESGGALGVFAAARDITERKRAEEQLRQASDYARSLLEASLDPLVTISPQGKITDVNAATERVTGIGREQLIGTDFSDYFSDPEQARAGYQKVFAEGSVVDYPLKVRHSGGSTTAVLYNASLYRDQTGKVIGIFAAARDVTERNRAEQALREASLYARSLLEASLDPLVTISAEGKITDVNAATESATGVPRERLIDTDFSDYFTDAEAARAGYQRVFAEGSVIDYPLAIRHASGAVTDVLYNAAIFRNERGAVLGVFAAARDVTELKRAQEALAERADALARSNADLEQFAYVASHDLQEPLRMVSSYTQLLSRRYEGKLDSDADEFIHFAVDGAKRMQVLINDLLAFSRVGTRGQPFARVETRLCLEEALANLKATIDEHDARVEAEDLPPAIVDRQQLVQLFQNLIANAIKFHGSDPPLVRVTAQRRGADWMFGVADNGIGIEPQYFERIFTIFQRLHARDEFPGTGIGLAICKKIVQRHGGRIWVESNPGSGSAFHFTIPIQGERSR